MMTLSHVYKNKIIIIITLCFPQRCAGIWSQRVNDNQQDLHSSQHPGAAVCGHLWIHQGWHLQLENQRRDSDKCHRRTQVMSQSFIILSYINTFLFSLTYLGLDLPAAETWALQTMWQVSMEWAGSSLMALVERWLELQHVSMLLLGLTALLQQVRGQNRSLSVSVWLFWMNEWVILKEWM